MAEASILHHMTIYFNVYQYIYSAFFFLHNCPLLIPLYNTAVLINICRFLINVVKLCIPLSKLDLPTLRNGSTEERMQRNIYIYIQAYITASIYVTRISKILMRSPTCNLPFADQGQSELLDFVCMYISKLPQGTFQQHFIH